MPSGGIISHFHRVADTACLMSSLDNPAPSLRNAEHTHAPGHACRTYSAYGQDVTQNAASVFRTKHRPGGTNCGVPGFWRL